MMLAVKIIVKLDTDIFAVKDNKSIIDISSIKNKFEVNKIF